MTNLKKYDYLIVGSGFCGSVIARKLAECRKKVIILERRNHIAGNMYDQLDDNGIIIQKYGPHIFHTNNDEVYSWITKYDDWESFNLNCMADIDGTLVPSPFNFKAIDLLYPADEAQNIKDELKKHYNKDKVTIVEMLNCENPIIKNYANMLFEKDYRPYTAKQWGIPPENIDISVLQRVPVLLSYMDSYFDDKYQILPKNGYTSFFNKLLDHPNITVQTGIDALSLIELNLENHCMNIRGCTSKIPVIYTGAIDELLEYKYGRLPYRSLKFIYKTEYTDSFQNAPVVAYPKADGYTRITEYKKLPVQNKKDITTIAYEYPLPYDESNSDKAEPYYPIPTGDNIALYNRYLEDVQEIDQLYLCGRLADYKYYNMDNAIERAFEVFNKIIS